MGFRNLYFVSRWILIFYWLICLAMVALLFLYLHTWLNYYADANGFLDSALVLTRSVKNA